MIGSSLIIFILLRVMPGDVALLILGGDATAIDEEELEKLRTELGINRPLPLQYFEWLKGLVTLDMGESLWTGEPVTSELARRFPVTIQLAVLSIVFAVLISFPLGILTAVYQDTWIDHVSRLFTVLGMALPNFWFATLIIVGGVVFFSWFPAIGSVPRLWEDPLSSIPRLMLPAVALGYRLSAVQTRMVRSSILEVLHEDYIRTARAKGLRERSVLYKHALKNAMLPVITLLGLEIGTLLSGSIIVENIFVLPGIGSTLVESVRLRDWPLTQSIVVTMVLIYLGINLFIDLTYGWLDPRIRYD